jgi:general secretion pathway protein M
MSNEHPIGRWLARYPALAVLCYVALLVALGFVTFQALTDIQDGRAALAAATDMLDRLEGRKPSGASAAPGDGAPTGSPFLEGHTITVAGAALQQRVTVAVGKLGGNVLSTQVDLQGPLAKEGFVSLVASLEVDQPALQQLLYDLEAGMPFLFVDQLVVQGPQAGTEPEGTRVQMRVLLAVSGQWQGAK